MCKPFTSCYLIPFTEIAWSVTWWIKNGARIDPDATAVSRESDVEDLNIHTKATSRCTMMYNIGIRWITQTLQFCRVKPYNVRKRIEMEVSSTLVSPLQWRSGTRKLPWRRKREHVGRRGRLRYMTWRLGPPTARKRNPSFSILFWLALTQSTTASCPRRTSVRWQRERWRPICTYHYCTYAREDGFKKWWKECKRLWPAEQKVNATELWMGSKSRFFALRYSKVQFRALKPIHQCCG